MLTIDELQQEALDASISVSQLLRKALILAKKLKDSEFANWINSELKGYEAEVPRYRIVRGQIKAFNPFNGWIPVMFENTAEAETFSTKHIGVPISEIESVYKKANEGNGNGTIRISYPPEIENALTQNQLVPKLIIQDTQFHGILDSVRNCVLDWVIKQEEQNGQALPLFQFPLINLTDPQKRWLDAVCKKYLKDEAFDNRLLKTELCNSIPRKFDPETIDKRLLKLDRPTIWGICVFDKKTILVEHIDKVLHSIRARVMTNSKISEVSATDVAKDVGISQSDIKRIMHLSTDLGRFWSNLSSDSIGIDEQVFNEYYSFEGINELLTRFVSRSTSTAGHITQTNRQADLAPFISREAPSAGKIFIIHGHDEALKQQVQLLLSRAALNDIVLHECPDKGRTIVEKLIEESQSATYAIGLFCPEDMMEDGQKRARQNVVLEIGYFLGKLGRERVRILCKGDVEIPSDLQGVLYEPVDKGGNWQMKLLKEMKAAGINCDIGKVLEKF